jgi:hypothetical protein
MTKFSTQHNTEMPDRVCVVIDDRLDVTLIRTEDGLRIEVYPITGGEVWDDPFDRFAVDEDEIRGLEQEMGDE